MKISTFFNIKYGVYFILFGLLVAVSAIFYANEQEITRNEQRLLNAYLIGSDLWHFVIDHDAPWDDKLVPKEAAQHHLPGKHLFWQEIIASNFESGASTGFSETRLQALRELEFPEQELEKLSAAGRCTDALLSAEKAGQAELAAEAKGEALKHIDEFFALCEARIFKDLRIGHLLTQICLTSIGSIVALMAILAAWSWLLVRRRMVRPVLSLQQQSRMVTDAISRLAKTSESIACGEPMPHFTVAIPPLGSTADDEIGELSRMQDGVCEKLQNTGDAIATVTETLAKVNASAEEQRQSLRLILDSLPDAVFIQETDGCIIDINDKAAEMFEIADKAEVLGRKPLVLSAPGNSEAAVRAHLEEALAGNAVYFEWSAQTLGRQRTFDAEIFLRPIIHEGRQRLLASIRDISERKRAEAAEREHARELEEMNRAMTGRELRVIALKEQVNELSQKLGRTRPYPPIWAEKTDAATPGGGQR